MPGIKNLILGLVLAAAGGAFLATADPGDGVLMYVVLGVIACGVLLFAGGLYQSVADGPSGADAEEVYKSDTITRLIMQSTIITALADGPLDDEEVEMIATACDSVVHERLDRNSIRRVANLVEKRGDEVLHEIHSEGLLLNPDARKAVLDACLLVLKADEKVDVRQTAAVTAIGRQLDYSDAETQSLIADALRDPKKG